MSPEEDQQIEKFVKVSGLTKQDYIARRVLQKEVVIMGNPRVYKALRDSFDELFKELKRIEAGEELDEQLVKLIRFMSEIMVGMKEGPSYE